MFLRIITVSLIILFSLQQDITVVNSIINQNTTYNIIIPYSTTLVAGAYLILQLPSASYPESSLTTVSCTPTCSRTSNIINFTSIIGSYSGGNITLRVSDIINPPTSQPLTYKSTVYNPPTPQKNDTFTYPFSPGNLASCNIQFDPNTVSTSGVAKFSVTPSNKVLAGSSIYIVFPTNWAYSVASTSILPASTPCVAVSNLNPISCSPSGYTVTINNGFSTNTSAFFSFNVSAILSIPVVYASTEVYIQTRMSSSAIIDNGTCTINTPNPKSTTITSSNAPKVGTSFLFTSTILVSNQISQDDYLSIIYPPSLTVVSSPTVTINLAGSNSDCGGTPISYNNLETTLASNVGTNYTYKMTNNRMNLMTSCSQVSITVTGHNISLPSTLAKSIQLTLSRTTNYYKYATGTLSISATTNTLSAATMQLTSDTHIINANVVFTLSFITATYLNTNSKVQITIPSQVQYQGSTVCSAGILNGASFTPTCSYSSNILNMSGFSSASSNSNITFTFSGFKNPASIVPVNFGVRTLYSDGYTVDELSATSYTATPDTITQFDVTSTSFTNGQTASYTVTYITKNNLPINSFVLIGLPIGITLNSTDPTCSLIVGGTPATGFSCSKVTSGGAYYNLGVNYTLNNLQIIGAGTNISFTIGLINNPITTQPSNSFSIYSNNLGNLIESTQGNTAFRIAMTTRSTFTSASILPSSQVNGATTDYVLSIRPSTRQPLGSVLSITIPINVTVLANYSCYNGSTQLICSYNNPTLNITLPQQLSAGSSYSITIRNIVNPRTMTQTSTFGLITDYSTYLVSSFTALGITNTLPNNINTLTMSVNSPSQSYMNSTQDILFTLITTNPLTTTDYIILTYPSGYKYLGTAGSSVSCNPYTCTPQASNASRLRVTNPFSPPTVTFSFTMSNYLSPNSTTNQNFAVQTYQADGTYIDRINTASSSALITFSITCTLPCRTCSILNHTQCLTCYSASIFTSPYLFNQNCYTTCPNITYTSGTDCIPCVSPCKTCTTVSLCTSCITNRYLFSDNSSCISECPATYYGNLSNQACQLCSHPCYNCSLSSTSCTSCQPLYLLQDNQCLLNCSNSYFNLSGICYPCDVSCARCTGISTNCTSCATGYSRSGSQCVSSCPATQLSLNGVCVNCSSSCYECAGTTTNCTSCVDGKFLYKGGCLVTCPNNTLLVNGVCVQNDTTRSLSDNKIIPFPYLISCAIICIICFLSKFSSPLTSIPAMGLSLNSIIQILGTVTILILIGIQNANIFASTSLKMIGTILILVGVVIDIIFNISTVVYFCKKIQTDIGYNRWKKRPSNNTVSRICIVLSGLYYKFIYFQFSKAFGSSHLHGTLENPVKFYPITIITLIGAFNSLFIITGCSLIALDSTTITLSAIYIQAIDCLLVKIVGAILALASLKKSQDFFDDPIKTSSLQDLNQQTLQGLNDNMNDSFMMEHSVSYVGGRPYYDNPDQDSRNKKLLLNSRNNPIRQQDQDDGADQGLDKKDPGIIDQQDYFKINDKHSASTNKLGKSGTMQKLGSKTGNQQSKTKLLDKNGNEIISSDNKKDDDIYNFDEDGEEIDQLDRKLSQNKVGATNSNNLNGNNNEGDQNPNIRNKSKSPNSKYQNNILSPSQNKKGNHKLNGDSQDELNEEMIQSIEENDFLSEENQGLKAQIKNNNRPLRQYELDDQNIQQNPSKTLGQQINLSSIEKKRSSRNKNKVNSQQLDKNNQDKEKLGQNDNQNYQNQNQRQKQKQKGGLDLNGKQRNKSKQKLNQNQNQNQNQINNQKQKQKKSNENTPINQLKNQSGINSSENIQSKQQGRSPKLQSKSKSPKGHVDRLEQIQSRELDEKQDSLICFQKDSNQRQEQYDSPSPPRKTNIKQKQSEDKRKEQEKHSLDNVVAAEELNNQSGLIDSSAYGTQMIQGLVRGMSNNQNEDKQKNNRNNDEEPSQLESAHQGDIEFPEVSPSQFNIQNQRYYDFNQTEYNPRGQSNRDYNMESFRRNNHTQHLYPGSQSQTSIINNPGFYENRTGALLPEERHNVPSGISKAYQSFDQPLASIHQKGKSIRVSQSRYMNQSLNKNPRYQTVTPDDINKRHKLKSLQKIYLQPLDTKTTQPLHKRSTKYQL